MRRPTDPEAILDEITSCSVRIADGERARVERLALFAQARELDPPIKFEALAEAAGIKSRHVVINALARRKP